MRSAILLLACAAFAIAQTEIQDGLFVRVTSDNSVIARRPPLRYPKQAMSALVQGTVVAKASVDSAGRVQSVAIVSGPEALREAVIASVQQWLFVPGVAERQVSVEFRIPAQDLAALEKIVNPAAPKGPRRPLAGRTVSGVQFMGVSLDAQEAVYEAMGIKTGDVLSNEAMDRAEEGLRKLDPKIQFKVLSVGDTAAVLILFRETARH